MWLVIPGRVRAGGKRRGHQPPLGLALQHLLAQAGEIPAAFGLGPPSPRAPARARDRRPGRAARGDRPRGRTAGRDRRDSGRACAGPRRSITAGAVTPSARYSAVTVASGSAPPRRAGSRLRPVEPGLGEPGAGDLGQRRGEVELRYRACRPSGNRFQARATRNGIRADPSRNDILNQSPRSPAISPWSAVNTTIVSSSSPVAAQRAEHLADQLVHVRDRRVVAVPGPQHLGIGQRPLVDAGHVTQAHAVRIGLGARDRRAPPAGRSPRPDRRPSGAGAPPTGRAGS